MLGTHVLGTLLGPGLCEAQALGLVNEDFYNDLIAFITSSLISLNLLVARTPKNRLRTPKTGFGGGPKPQKGGSS